MTLPATELRLVTVAGRVVLDLDDEIRVGETNAIAGGRAVVVRVSAAIDSHLQKSATALSAAT
jgi:hypothetical protein